MLTHIFNYFNLEMIYLWVNYGVIPLWLTLIFFPHLKSTQIFITSIFLPLIFSTIYIYIVYQLFYLGENIFELFNLYKGLDNLIELISNEQFLLLFWIHFLSINLFLGSWVARDAVNNSVPKVLSGLCLILIYFSGPIGLIIYWFTRIFFAKKINLHD